MVGLVRLPQKLSLQPLLQTLFGFEFLLLPEADRTTTPSNTTDTTTLTIPKLTSTMPTHYLKITTPMACGGCTGTIEKALRAVPGVSGVSVSLDSQAARVVTTNDEIACQCAVCNCGPKCECMDRSLVAAVAAVGFEGAIGTEADFTCGKTTTTTTSTSSSTTTRTAGTSSCGNDDCTCGANCQCGYNCRCAGCPGSAPRSNFKSMALAYVTPTNLTISVALIGIGWMAAIKFAK